MIWPLEIRRSLWSWWDVETGTDIDTTWGAPSSSCTLTLTQSLLRMLRILREHDGTCMHKFNLVGIITQDISGYCQALAHHLYPIHPNSNLTILADGLWRRMSQQAKIVSSQRTPVELFDYLALTAESIWNTWSVCPVSSSSRIKRPVPPGSLWAGMCHQLGPASSIVLTCFELGGKRWEATIWSICIITQFPSMSPIPSNSINGWLSAGRGMDGCGGRMCQNQQT